jgi:hypothetical protein
MTVRDNEIVAACAPILRRARRHRGQGRTFISAYQMWGILRRNRHPICESLIQAYGRALGRGGGAPIGPAQRIAQALSRSTVVETQYLDTREIRFRDPRNGRIYEASVPDCGIFRM